MIGNINLSVSIIPIAPGAQQCLSQTKLTKPKFAKWKFCTDMKYMNREIPGNSVLGAFL